MQNIRTEILPGDVIAIDGPSSIRLERKGGRRARIVIQAQDGVRIIKLASDETDASTFLDPAPHL